jgi:steroid delta-isomerase-like uncharacterized protein
MEALLSCVAKVKESLCCGDVIALLHDLTVIKDTACAPTHKGEAEAAYAVQSTGDCTMSTPAAKVVTPTDLASSFFSAYDAHDVDAMVAMCSEDAQLRYVPMGAPGQGDVRAVGRRIWSGLIEAFPDLSVKVRSMFGNKTDAAAEVMIGGTQQKDFMQIRNSGKRYDLPHAFLLRMNDRGLIGELAAYWDNASFYMQLGKTTLD